MALMMSGTMNVHELKSWPEFFEPLLSGEKTFELRRNDRNFAVGHLLVLKEWEPDKFSHWQSGRYTGREVCKRIVYILEGIGPGGIEPLKGLQQGFVILGLGPE